MNFSIIGEIIVLLAIFGSGMVLYVSYIFWCAGRFGRNFNMYFCMTMAPAIVLITGCIWFTERGALW